VRLARRLQIAKLAPDTRAAEISAASPTVCWEVEATVFAVFPLSEFCWAWVLTPLCTIIVLPVDSLKFCNLSVIDADGVAAAPFALAWGWLISVTIIKLLIPSIVIVVVLDWVTEPSELLVDVWLFGLFIGTQAGSVSFGKMHNSNLAKRTTVVD